MATDLWQEIAWHYGEKGRYYHTLAHLEHLLGELAPYQRLLADPDAVLFALFYHDLIYRPTRPDNEEKSAARAGARLRELGVPAPIIARCEAHILATRHGDGEVERDTALFTDADLSILGAEPAAYFAYAEKVRKEYGIFPDLIYKPGRRKVLKHFLVRRRIFRTDEFADQYEAAARRNLEQELAMLQP